ncbi:MAG: IS200/IS605 family transposase [Chitinophagales bacterium]
MPNTYTQIYIQVVFAVSFREGLIHPKWEEELYKYIAGIVRKKGHKLIAINGMPDHVHLLMGITGDCRISDLVREIKKASTQFINDRGFVKVKFKWQEGYGAFSYSRNSIGKVASYIENQKEHHRIKKFKEEFLGILKSEGVEYREEYLFNWLE